METVKTRWGEYTTLFLEGRIKVKVLRIDPEQNISHQYHLHRSEKWIVVSGMGRLKLDKSSKEIFLPEGSEINIEATRIHSLKAGPQGLVLIEIQQGQYLEEDDIVRIDYQY